LKQLAREIISRIAMVILGGILLAGGIIVAAMQFYAGFISAYTLLLAIGLIAAGGFLIFAVFLPSQEVSNDPDDSRYRIK
jgi:hypothetical protein